MKEIILSDGSVATVDDDDFDRLSRFRWHPKRDRNGQVYACAHGPGSVRVVNGKTIDRRAPLSMHRVVLDAPRGVKVDHKDCNGLNNQKSNLRFATTATNGFNRRKHTRKTSRFKGVYFNKRLRKWCVYLDARSVGGHVYGGSFADEETAAHRYDELARQYCGEFARCNFPEAA